MKALVLVFALAVPSAALGQMRAEQCRVGLTAVQEIMGPAAPDLPLITFSVTPEGWCEAVAIRTPLHDYQDLAVDVLRWRAEGIDRFLDEGLPPTEFELEMEGAHFITKTGDDVTDYLMGIMMSRQAVDGGLSLRWEAEEKALLIDRAELDFPGDNSIALTGRVDGVDLSDIGTIQTSLGRAGLTELDVTIISNGLFETLFIMPVGTALLDEASDVPPGDQVVTLVAQGKAALAAVPEALLPTDSRTALNGLLDEMPFPSGALQMSLRADRPVGMARFLPLAMMPRTPTPDDVFQALVGVELGATWTPTEEDAE